MSPSRFSPEWHRGDASIFSRIVGTTPAQPVNHDDPIHRERVQRYERNIRYYQLAQYADENQKALRDQDFLSLRVNYTSITQRSVETKADWLFGKPVGINVVPMGPDGKEVETLPISPADIQPGAPPTDVRPVSDVSWPPFMSAADGNGGGATPALPPGLPPPPPNGAATAVQDIPAPSDTIVQEADSTTAPSPTNVHQKPDTMAQRVKDRINEIREYNDSNLWDWIMAVMGYVCGDVFVIIDAEPDDIHPSVTLMDPSYCFPDYPKDANLPMRACQLQYDVDYEGDPTEEQTMTTRRIVEDYRLEIVNRAGTDEFEGLAVLSDEEMADIRKEEQQSGRPSDRLTCIYRKFEDGALIQGSKRDIGIPAIPIVHGRNLAFWNSRYGTDEISSLIPMVEKLNETFFYAERIGRQNAHARLFVSGMKSETAPIKSDYDDVIYGGENVTANVITLPTDTSVLQFTTDRLEVELHRTASIPVIAQGEAEVGYGAPSGLALLIRFGPLQAITRRHQTMTGHVLNDIYKICLMFDEMVIDGVSYGSKWKYDTWKFKYDWYDAMPRSLGEIIGDMVQATGGKPLLSLRTAREFIPGVDPDVEEKRDAEEIAAQQQASLAAMPPGAAGAPTDGSTPADGSVPPDGSAPTDGSAPPADGSAPPDPNAAPFGADQGDGSLDLFGGAPTDPTALPDTGQPADPSMAGATDATGAPLPAPVAPTTPVPSGVPGGPRKKIVHRDDAGRIAWIEDLPL